MSNHNIGSKQRRKIIRALIRRDGDRCYWRGCEFTFKRPRTIDHVIPRSAGGVNALVNLVLACQPCNRDRTSYPLPLQSKSARSDEDRARIRDLARGSKS